LSQRGEEECAENRNTGGIKCALIGKKGGDCGNEIGIKKAIERATKKIERSGGMAG
jgi:hypothetical protein